MINPVFKNIKKSVKISKQFWQLTCIFCILIYNMFSFSFWDRILLCRSGCFQLHINIPALNPESRNYRYDVHIWLKILIPFLFFSPSHIHKQALFAIEQEFKQRKGILCHSLTSPSPHCCACHPILPDDLVQLVIPCLMPTVTIWDLYDVFGTGRWVDSTPPRADSK